MLSSLHRPGAALLLGLFALGCGGGSSSPTENTPTKPVTPSPDVGKLEIKLVRVPGSPALRFHTSVRVGNGSFQGLYPGRPLTKAHLPVGEHVVQILDVQPAYCELQGQASKTVSITKDQTTQVTFEVLCTFNPETRITFQRADGVEVAVWTIRPDGTDPRKLVGGYSWCPWWSPDGTRIAFAGPNMTIMVMNYDGTEVGTVYSDKGAKPVWSADGTRLAFHDDGVPQGSTREIRAINLDGTDLVNLTNDPVDDKTPGWSHDGSKIAFCKAPGALWVMNADGTAPVALTGEVGCGGPAWSPDDQEIVFASLGPVVSDGVQIWRIGADGTGLTRLTTIEPSCGGPDYLPDGSAIIFHCPQVGLETRAWIMDADGENQRLFEEIPWPGVAHLHWWSNQ